MHAALLSLTPMRSVLVLSYGNKWNGTEMFLSLILLGQCPLRFSWRKQYWTFSKIKSLNQKSDTMVIIMMIMAGICLPFTLCWVTHAALTIPYETDPKGRFRKVKELAQGHVAMAWLQSPHSLPLCNSMMMTSVLWSVCPDTLRQGDQTVPLIDSCLLRLSLVPAPPLLYLIL